MIAQGLSRDMFITENDGYTLGMNSKEQVFSCIDEMLSITEEIFGWRKIEDNIDKKIGRNYFEWPLKPVARHRLAV